MAWDLKLGLTFFRGLGLLFGLLEFRAFRGLGPGFGYRILGSGFRRLQVSQLSRFGIDLVGLFFMILQFEGHWYGHSDGQLVLIALPGQTVSHGAPWKGHGKFQR